MNERNSRGAAFRRYFLSMQLAAGLAMAARGFIEGIKEGWLSGLLWALGGFLFVLPVSAMIALVYALMPPTFFVNRIRWVRTLATGIIMACLIIGTMIGADLYFAP